MQRFTASGGSAGVSNNSVGGVGGVSARENARVDPSFQTSNFSQNSRRPLPLHPFKLKVDKDPLNSRLGPPDFYPQTPSCPEETLTKEYLQSGYKETVEGIEEAREIVLTQASYFTKAEIILKCKEAIRRRFRAINDSRTQKRKAGQVYGVPLTGHLLIKPGSFPEQRPSNEDFRKKWIEALSSHTKRLKTLADHVPHGYRRKSLFEVLIRYNVPLLRATWLIKVTYLNQLRPVSTSISPISLDKVQFSRTELWTKDVVEYLQQLLDEYFSKDGSIAPASSRDQSSPSLLSGSSQKNDSGGAASDAEEPSLLSKWWYMVHLLHWNYSEGLILPSVIVEWVLNQLQEKDSVDAFELLLPVACEVIDIIALSQTYTSGLVDIAIRSINDLSLGGSSVIETSRRSSLSSAFVEILRYLILAAPDTFVALDCFPLPVSVVPDMYSLRRTLKTTEDIDFFHVGKHDNHFRYLSFGYAAFTIQRRASNLASIANPGVQGHGSAKIVQLLDKAFISGDARLAYSALFEDFSDLSIEEKWMEEVSPSLRSSLKWIGTVDLSLICSVFFLCEWATCGYRNYRTISPSNLKFTGMKDFSKVYTAVLLLKLKMEHICISSQSKNANLLGSTGKAVSLHENLSSMATLENSFLKSKSIVQSKNGVDVFQSSGPLHDIIVCWLDQHEIAKGEGYKHLQVLIMELIRNGIFYPPAYVRHLIVSGIMDRCETAFDLERRKRHHRILKQLPGSCLFDVLEESEVLDAASLIEVVQAFTNERQLVLQGSLGQSSRLVNKQDNSSPFSVQKQNDISFTSKESSSTRPFVNAKVKDHLTELKVLISTLLRFPYTCSSQIETQVDESSGCLKRLLGSSGIKFDSSEGMHTCDDGREGKRQKLTEERGGSSHQAITSNLSDDEDTWWVRKGPKSLESMKVEPANKLAKNVARGRQKTGRKMQSLSQLAAARIESSQGASTSHVCDNKMSCPHHRSGVEGKVPKDAARLKTIHLSDIGKTVKQLRLLEKRSISIWLSTSIRQLVDGIEKTVSKPSNGNGSFSSPIDDRSTVRWKLGEEELSTILYILDISSDMILAVKLLLWLLSKTLCGQINNGHVGRNIMMLTKSRESHVFQVGEAFLLSALQRYENVIVATDLLPELLSAVMHRTMASLTPNGRTFCSASFTFARNLQKKYREMPTVVRWEKHFRATCDQRLFTDLDTGRLHDGDVGFSSGISGGINDFDEYIRQKITGRVSRTGSSMKEIVQRHVEEAMHYFYGKERKPFTAANANSKNSTEKWDDAYQVAHEIVTGLSDCIRQNGSTALEADPSIVASAVSSIVCNVGPSVVKVPDFISCNYQSLSSTSTSFNCVRYILYIHIISLCLLKEALGERFGRIFEIALATEASAAISGSLSSGKSHRNPYQPSTEAHDISPNHSAEGLNNSSNFVGLRVAKATAAISALVLGAIVHGAANLERMVTVFKLKEGLDVLPFIRSARSSSNGISRSIGNLKLEHSVEVLTHWFRLLIGNAGTVCDGLVSEILGESYIIALSKMQRMLPLNLVLPPVYSIFAMVIWRPHILSSNIATREDIHLYHHLSLTFNELIRHQPFRDLCFQNTHAFYDILAADVGDSEFAAMLELHNPDKLLKARAFVPLRARLFLNALIDCKMPPNTLLQEDGSFISESIEALKYTEMEQNLLNQLVHVLDTLQPAKFHWQWVELRLLLNEKALLDKIDMKDISLVEGIRSLSPNADNFSVSESDKFLSEIILTRILARPDAAPLYAEIVHLLGRSLEESLVMDIKWILAGSDVLSGRKSIRQQLISVAQRKSLSTKPLFWKPWGWSNMTDVASNKSEKNKLEMITIEEGEVVDDSCDVKRSNKMNFSTIDADSFTSSQQYLTEKAIAELILPCIDRSSTDLCNSFAVELIKQMNMIDQQINVFTRGGNKQAGVGPSGVEASSNKGSSRKSMRGGSPGLGRRATTAADSSPPSAAALKASIWLRLQFLVRLLPIIFSDRNMRQMLASIMLHLMGTRFIYEDAEISLSMAHLAPVKREMESIETSANALIDYSGDSLFDTFLCLLHGLMSSCRPIWLKPKSASKSSSKSPRDFSAFDRDAIELMQADLDRMDLPLTIRRRLQAAFPILPTSLSTSLSSHRPVMPPAASASSTQPSTLLTNSSPSNKFTQNRLPAKTKTLPAQEIDTEIDPWTLLEDGTTCSATSGAGGSSGTIGGDHSNLKACSWLKGAVRMRRTDLTYVGVVDDES